MAAVVYNTPLMSWFKSVRATLLPTPGAMEYGFASEYLVQHPLLGPGIAARRTFRSYQGNQSYQAAMAVAQTGLGGLASGNVILQPLSNPYGQS